MPEINLPDISIQWSQGGDILKPSDAKIQSGWGEEIPPRQWFNWLDNRQDQAIAHIAQHGIVMWNDHTEYQAGKSYVQGSDGLIYKALTTHVNTDPVGAAPGTWESAFLTAAQATQVATATQSRAMTANDVYLSPLQLANAFTGTKQELTVNMARQTLPGGVIVAGGFSAGSNTDGFNFTFPTPFPTKCSSLVLTCSGGAGLATDVSYAISNLSATGCTIYRIGSNTTVEPFYWIAIGN